MHCLALEQSRKLLIIKLGAAQKGDPELCKILESEISALKLKKIHFSDCDNDIYCGVAGDAVCPSTPAAQHI